MKTSPKPQLEIFFERHGLADYDALLARAENDPDWFWPAVMAHNELWFHEPFSQLLDTSRGPEWARWCIGGMTNVATNCLSRRHAADGMNPTAIEWVGEDDRRRIVGFATLREQVARAAGGLRALGIGRGDVVAIYMPSVPEAVIAFHAIASLGAIVLPVFSGFGAAALIERLGDSGAKAIFTVDITQRNGVLHTPITVLSEVRKALPNLRHVIVAARGGEGCTHEGAICWQDLSQSAEPVDPVPLPSETPLMIVYTSGTSGRPKGTVHSHCGFMTKVALDFGLVLDLNPTDRVLWAVSGNRVGARV